MKVFIQYISNIAPSIKEMYLIINVISFVNNWNMLL